MNEQRVSKLLKEYENGTISAENKAALEAWYQQQALLRDNELTADELEQSLEYLKTKLPLTFTQEKQLGTNQKIITLLTLAAAVIVIVATGTYFALQNQNVKQKVSYVQEIAPPKNTAVLTLSNGSHILLNGLKTGTIAKQGDNDINKTANGDLTYHNARTEADQSKQATVYNTITTPNGGEFKIELSDGTQVTLNARSSLTYPVSFTSLKERRIQLSGEAYFEVAHNKAMPFRVTTGNHTVEVLGTHFNVMAYPDEKAIETTLVEGSVKVMMPGNAILIKPGQQAQASSGSLKINDHIDMDDVLAWKNGYFIFNDDDLPAIMRKIGRWYNVDIAYKNGEPGVENLKFGGIVSRNRNLSVVLNTMERTGKVKFTVIGRKITVVN